MKQRDIFIEAMQKEEGEERRIFLDVACGDDVELREGVNQLLAEHQKDGSFFLDSPPPGIGATLDQPITEKPGTQIGPYKLLQRIGEGGMGVVYMAEQSEPVKRRVALKIIKPGMDTREVIARFEAERQALALMDHPNVAKVLDAGATDSGLPYFVMELVNGLPVTKFCDEQHLTPKERLQLFVPICKAIQHAHQKGIIHRDLKPSNILVAMYDNQAVPKIIDFGVAKATNQTLTDKTMFTQLGQVVGTLEYMSPEQAQRNQLDIDTRSDIYSLGVVLYELLAGETPLDRERLKSAAFDEMLRIIREEEPPKPSTKVSGSVSLPAIAANRRMEPSKLGNTIRGELDWIVMKALEKDRARRYSTPNEMAEDIESHLDGKAVTACPPSMVYRATKFVRRNRIAILVSGAIAATLLAGLAGTTWQAWRASEAEQAAIADRELANEQKDKAEALKEQAEREAARAKAMSQFLRSDLLGLARGTTLVNTASDMDPDMTLRTLLERAKGRLDKRFFDHPDHKRQVQRLLMYSYCGIGQYDEASKLLEDVVQDLKQRRGIDLETLDSMSVLAQLYMQQLRWHDALPLLKEALQERKRRLGIRHPKTQASMNNLATTYRILGDFDAAAELFEVRLKVLTEVHGNGHPETTAALSRMGDVLVNLGRHEEAERKLLRAIDQIRLTSTKEGLAGSLNSLGQLYLCTSRYRSAIPVLEESHQIRVQELENDSRNTADTKLALATAYLGLERFEQADPLLEEAFAVLQQNQGIHVFTTLEVLEVLANISYGQGNFDRAEQALNLSLAILDASQIGDWRKPKILSLLADISIAKENPSQAKAHLMQAYKCHASFAVPAGSRSSVPSHEKRFAEVNRRVIEQLVTVHGLLDDDKTAASWCSKLDLP